ncbi:SRPBCC family protein [Streptomyces sp. AJS327]|uniref:SRPBCC family protein n=1 Tax=Streptomyces sp. AJS327 TaxID=2545265 RepID=UPI0015E05A82|nr:SRPBCC family protein [Streptomyces sp. AJS327]MBA0053972.1 SRPBCC family protein [Streptomyces sp. AJS327]
MTAEHRAAGARTEVELTVNVPVERFWELVTDVSRNPEWSPECSHARWLDGATGPAPGARFEARNRFSNGLVTEVMCVVTEVEPPYVFAWDVHSDAPERVEPLAHWRYHLDVGERPEQTLVRQSFTHGPAESGVTMAQEADPGNAEAALTDRLDELRRHMTVTLRAMEASATRTGS